MAMVEDQVIDQNTILSRLKEIEEEEKAPRPSASMDWRHDDWGDGNGSYWVRLKLEKKYLLNILGLNKPDKYMTSSERFAKYGKSPMMLAQELASQDD